MPHIMLPTIEVIVLLLSCIPAYWGSEAAKRNDLPGITRNLVFNGLLAVLAVVIRAIYWLTFNFNWKTDIHGSVVWMIMTLHTFETVTAIIVTAFLLLLIALGRFTDTHRKGVDFDSFTWYFVVGIWLPIYATIFIAPYILQSS
jgi:cytochrome c oxidase subunit I+III